MRTARRPWTSSLREYGDEIAHMLATGDVSKLGIDLDKKGIAPETVKAYLMREEISHRTPMLFPISAAFVTLSKSLAALKAL